jgi:hypothetical protein
MKKGTRLYRASVLGTVVLGVGMLGFGTVALAQTVLGTGNHDYECTSGDAMTITSIGVDEAGVDCATTTTGSTTTTTSGTTTTTSGGSLAEVQADDTGTINGNTTSIGSGYSNQVLLHNTGIGHTVILVIQTLTYPGTQTDTVSSVSSGMGTFQFVNSYNDDADNEIWICTDTTGASDSVTVNTSTNAWDALAVEYNEPATSFESGGGEVWSDLGYLSNQSLTVTPEAAGNVVLVDADTLDAFVTDPSSPWTHYNSGYWDNDNGTGAAWQIVPSSSPVTATWETDGGLSSSQGVVVGF